MVLGNHEFYVLGDTRFLGATLWTDFALYGTGSRLLQAMNDEEWAMNDCGLIRHSDVELFYPEHAQEIHFAQVRWLEGKLLEIFDGPTVVITHYLPHRPDRLDCQRNVITPAPVGLNPQASM
jgi:hypothetical protein